MSRSEVEEGNPGVSFLARSQWVATERRLANQPRVCCAAARKAKWCIPNKENSMVSNGPKGQNSALRAIFDEDAATYESIRPDYPAQLIEDVVSFSQIPSSGRILEVGCGTGQATLPFAQRGYTLLCIDIGEEMLKIARKKLETFPQIAFWGGPFEDWPLEEGAFDLFISATAFHWVPREVGYPKAAAALKPGGTLAIINNEHPQPSSGFFEEVQEVYARYASTGGDSRNVPTTSEKIRELSGYIDSTRLFAPVTVRTVPWKQTYTTAEYLALLNTYSDHRAMEASRREGLFAGIAGLIERRYGGQVMKDYLAVLYLAKKV
jgi:ubiquinone/menaquinone biosynthesis C-methylase UbiE